jgi:hypothetical protein
MLKGDRDTPMKGYIKLEDLSAMVEVRGYSAVSVSESANRLCIFDKKKKCEKPHRIAVILALASYYITSILKKRQPCTFY